MIRITVCNHFSEEAASGYKSMDMNNVLIYYKELFRGEHWFLINIRKQAQVEGRDFFGLIEDGDFGYYDNSLVWRWLRWGGRELCITYLDPIFGYNYRELGPSFIRVPVNGSIEYRYHANLRTTTHYEGFTSMKQDAGVKSVMRKLLNS